MTESKINLIAGIATAVVFSVGSFVVGRASVDKDLVNRHYDSFTLNNSPLCDEFVGAGPGTLQLRDTNGDTRVDLCFDGAKGNPTSTPVSSR